MKNKQIKQLAKKKLFSGVVLLLCYLTPVFIIGRLTILIADQIDLGTNFQALNYLISIVIPIFIYLIHAPLSLGVKEAFIMLSNNEKVTVKSVLYYYSKLQTLRDAVLLELVQTIVLVLFNISGIIIKNFFGNENKVAGLLNSILFCALGFIFYFCPYYYLIFKANWWDSIKKGVFFFIKENDRLLRFFVSFIPLIICMIILFIAVFSIEGNNSKHIITYIVFGISGLSFYSYYRLSAAIFVKDVFGIAPPKKNIKHKEKRGK